MIERPVKRAEKGATPLFALFIAEPLAGIEQALVDPAVVAGQEAVVLVQHATHEYS